MLPPRGSLRHAVKLALSEKLNVNGKLRHFARATYHHLFPRLVASRYLQNRSGDEIEMDYLDLLVYPNRDAVDVGANLGRYCVLLAGLVSQVWAFEPHPRLAQILVKSLPHNVIVKQAAISSRRGTIDLKVPLRRNKEVESLGTLESGSYIGPHRYIKVPMLTLDEQPLQNIGFMKIDVEGHELSVVEGALTLLAQQRPTVLVEADEHHQRGAVVALYKLMASAGYQGLFIRCNAVHRISDFDAATMQKEEDLRSGLPRKECPYVNNFIFAPDGQPFASLWERLAARMTGPDKCTA